MLWNFMFWLVSKIACYMDHHNPRLSPIVGNGLYCGDCMKDLEWNL
jgi:hypothetical protein